MIIDINKNVIVQEFLRHERERVAILHMNLMDAIEASDIDEGDVIEPEDLSHQVSANELKASLKAMYEKAVANYENLKTVLDDKEGKTGSLLISDNEVILLGINVAGFYIDNYFCYGVSTEAPVYRKLKGAQVGDEFVIGERKIIVLDFL